MKRKTKNVLIIGDLRKINFGDALIAQALRESYLEEGFAGVKCLSMTMSRSFAENDIGILKFISIARYLRSCKEVCIGGGGIFQDDTGRLNIIYFALWAIISRAFFCDLVVRSVSITRLRYHSSRFGVRLIARLAKSCSMRDYESGEYFHRLTNIHPSHEDDPVFTWLSLKKSDIRKKALGIIKGSTEGFLLTYLRPSPKMERNPVDFDLLITEVVSLSKDLSLDLRFGYFDKSKDLDFTGELLDKAGLGENIMVHDQTPTDAIRRISEAKIVISMRLHPAIIASALGIPFVAVSYNDKVRNYFASKGQSSRVVRTSQVQELGSRARSSMQYFGNGPL